MPTKRINQIAGAPDAKDKVSIADRLSWLIVSVTTVVLPLVVSLTGKDAFRLPKQLFLEGSAIILAAVAICATILGVPFAHTKRWPRTLVIVIGAVLLWSAVTTVVSTNPILSIFSLIELAAAIMVFIAAYNAVASRPLTVLYIALAPALINAVVAIAQRTGIWIPFDAQPTARLNTIALLGNPDDLGMFLVAPTLAAVALGITSKKYRLAATIIAAVLSTALVASETLGAIAALATGVFVLLVTARPRAAGIAALLIVLLATGVVRLSPRRWSDTREKVLSAAHGDYDPLLSGRMPGFLTAWRMFRYNPLVGVGLGCFKFQYFDQKIAVAAEHPFMKHHPENFGEAHNEHLQILAEGGLPAYAIFIGALSVLARISFCRAAGVLETRAAFARTLALPLAVAIFVLTLSSFPLRIAAPTQNALFICALTFAWSGHASD